ncbi:hypothetical protein DAEQUDRAFT_760909 [Daedalea quercina L-15889]|uniref:Uncharacterized protein n=1 Tax=Daedalea quercina L-15889 TaxID=1314783 RepID=A0A165UHQ4_9APHY|nr:hypothetical protein DAEQUDRAFT_760909 [Daedalea quercina L-15889]
MRSTTVIAVAALISAPALVAMLPVPASQGVEAATQTPLAHMRHKNGLNHESYPPYLARRPSSQQNGRRPRPNGSSRQSSGRIVGHQPYPDHTCSRGLGGQRNYVRKTQSKAISVSGLVDAAKNLYRIGDKAYTIGNAYEAGKAVRNSSRVESRADASSTISLGEVGKDVYAIGTDAPYDAYKADRDAWHVIKGRAVGSEAISAENVLEAGNDVKLGTTSTARMRRARMRTTRSGAGAWTAIMPHLTAVWIRLCAVHSAAGSGTLSTQNVLQAGGSVFQIGHDAYDAYEAGKDAYHQFKGRAVGSEALSPGQVFDAAKDAWTVGNDAYKAGRDAWNQVKSRSLNTRKVSVEGALKAGGDVVQIGNDVYDAYKAGEDAWHAIKGRSPMDELD